MAVLLSGYGAGGESNESACAAAPKGPSLELVYRLEAGEKKVTPGIRDEAMEIVCKRLKATGRNVGQVRALANKRFRVVMPQIGSLGRTQRAAEQIAVTGQLSFYDWEPNLIGPERRVGGHPGRRPPAGALRRTEREWRAAGREVKGGGRRWLILAGAFPNAYGAVKLASTQKPREHCAACSSSTPRFYMFDRSPAHKLVAGPVADRAELRNAAAGRRHRRDDIVLKVPVGTRIVSEQPTDHTGEPIAVAEPGWFALKDDVALDGSEIVRPNQEVDELGLPVVTFGFTRKGRVAFHRLTRAIARRGQRATHGSGGRRRAEALSGHFAVVFDGEVKTRPIVDFAYFPHGIDGRVGAQISGGFANIEQARRLATILKIGALPINLTLMRQQVLHYQRGCHTHRCNRQIPQT
jgi:SecD/SecF fusion protein